MKKYLVILIFLLFILLFAFFQTSYNSWKFGRQIPPLENSKFLIKAVFNQKNPITFYNNLIAVNPNLLYMIPTSEYRKELYDFKRDPISYPFNEGNMSLLILGDSYSWGLGVKQNETWPSILSKTVSYKVFNFAISGINTKIEVGKLEKRGIEYNPNLVILQYCFNDFEDTYEQYNLADNISFEFEKRGLDYSLSSIHKAASSFYEKFVFKKNPEKEFEEEVLTPLEKLYNLSQTNNFTVWVLMLPSPPFQTHLLNERFNKYGWRIFDIHELLDFEYDPPFTLDNGHFSVQTHKKVAELLKLKLENAKLS